MTAQRFVITSSGAGRADKAISSLLPQMSRAAVARLIDDGSVVCNGRPVKKSTLLVPGDAVSVFIPEPKPCTAQAERIPLDVVYEDGDLLVVNKPKGMVVHPAAGNYSGTLVNALLAYCGDSLSGINGVLRPGIVHRIDKNTSGLLIVAKNDRSHKLLAEQIKVHSFDREYQAVVVGGLKADEGTVHAPIGRHPVKRKQMAVTDKNSKDAVTHWNVLGRYRGYTHLKLRLETGRTHQIRVHMAHIGHPVAGDDLYGGGRISGFDGQCLHAGMIGFTHPTTGEHMTFVSELPPYFKDFLNRLEQQ